MGFFDTVKDGVSGAVDKVKDAGAAAKEEVLDAAEVAALVSFGVIPFLATWLQEQRKAFGLPRIDNPGYFAIFAITIVIVSGLIIGFVYTLIFKFINVFTSVGTGERAPMWKIIIFCLVIGFVVSFILYFMFVAPALRAANVDIAKQVATTLSVESFVNQAPDTSLINLQSLAVKQTAYIGPSEVDGVFDATVGVQSALKVGVRVFVLQISYLDVKKDSSKFDEQYVPTLVYRNDAGDLISSNGANIKEVAKTLAAYGFSESMNAATQPLILYLHFQRTPNALREPEKYVKFLSSVAERLEPLQEFMLGSTSEGNFKRQQNENILLTTPVSTFEKKIIVLCNADTSAFRNVTSLGLDNIDTKYDLDFMVNIRVYLDDSNSDKLGVTTQPLNGEKANAVIVPFNSLEGLSQEDMDKFAMKGKSRYVIAMPSQMKNPTADSIKTVIGKCGVNCVPLNLFGEAIDELKGKIKAWNGQPFYTVKGQSYRSLSQPNSV